LNREMYPLPYSTHVPNHAWCYRDAFLMETTAKYCYYCCCCCCCCLWVETDFSEPNVHFVPVVVPNRRPLCAAFFESPRHPPMHRFESPQQYPRHPQGSGWNENNTHPPAAVHRGSSRCHHQPFPRQQQLLLSSRPTIPNPPSPVAAAALPDASSIHHSPISNDDLLARGELVVGVAVLVGWPKWRD
jgi:hypothetical protein